MNRRLIGLLFVCVAFVVSTPVAVADEPTAIEVQSWLTGDLEQQEDEIRAWVESDNSSEYPELRENALQFLEEIENQREEAKSDLSGEQINVSENMNILGYEFDTENETATIVIETESTTPVSVRDYGATFSGSSNRYEVETRTIGGVERVEIRSVPLQANGFEGHAVDIFDGQSNKGYILKDKSETSGFFDEPDAYMIGLSAVTGAFTVAILSVLRIRNKENKGIGELIPLR